MKKVNNIACTKILNSMTWVVKFKKRGLKWFVSIKQTKQNKKFKRFLKVLNVIISSYFWVSHYFLRWVRP